MNGASFTPVMKPIYSPHPGYPAEIVAMTSCDECGGITLTIVRRQASFSGTLPVEHVDTRCTTCGATGSTTFDTTAYTCKC